MMSHLISKGFLIIACAPKQAHSAPAGPLPAAISVNLAPDAPEDAALVAQNLVDMQQLWDDWHGFAPRELKGEQVTSPSKQVLRDTGRQVQDRIKWI